MTDTIAPVSHLIIEMRSERIMDLIHALDAGGFWLRAVAESSLPARPLKADYEITDVEVGRD